MGGQIGEGGKKRNFPCSRKWHQNRGNYDDDDVDDHHHSFSRYFTFFSKITMMRILKSEIEEDVFSKKQNLLLTVHGI